MSHSFQGSESPLEPRSPSSPLLPTSPFSPRTATRLERERARASLARRHYEAAVEARDRCTGASKTEVIYHLSEAWKQGFLGYRSHPRRFWSDQVPPKKLYDLTQCVRRFACFDATCDVSCFLERVMELHRLVNRSFANTDPLKMSEFFLKPI